MTSDWKKISFKDLTIFTDGFSDKNFIGQTQFGKLYHGKIPGENGMDAQNVTVKIWVDPAPELYTVDPGDKSQRMQDEIMLLRDHKLTWHPSLVKHMGCCWEGEQIGVVYDLKSLDTVLNLAVKESNSFSWLQRIKVAVGFGCFLEFLHSTRQSLVRNISPAHIMLDQEYCPRLIDFGMLSGGILPDKRNIRGEQLWGCHGYLDPMYALPGGWSEKTDVFSFGCVLIGLISKRVFYDRDFSRDNFPIGDLYYWAREAYLPKKSVDCFGRSKPYYSHRPPKPGCFGPYKQSLVHKSLKADRGFYSSDGRKISDLMIRCVDELPMYRPTMKEVVQSLLKLRVVRRYAKELRLEEMVPEATFLISR